MLHRNCKIDTTEIRKPVQANNPKSVLKVRERRLSGGDNCAAAPSKAAISWGV